MDRFKICTSKSKCYVCNVHPSGSSTNVFNGDVDEFIVSGSTTAEFDEISKQVKRFAQSIGHEGHPTQSILRSTSKRSKVSASFTPSSVCLWVVSEESLYCGLIWWKSRRVGSALMQPYNLQRTARDNHVCTVWGVVIQISYFFRFQFIHLWSRETSWSSNFGDKQQAKATEEEGVKSTAFLHTGSLRWFFF